MKTKHGARVVQAELHALRLIGRFRLGGSEQLPRQMFASERSEHSISDPIRQDVRPLVDGLVGHTNCVCGGGYGTAEEFDGLGLKHGSLNHSSGDCATIVQGPARTLATMVEKTEFKDRLASAMKEAGASVNDVAKACEISYQAVVKLVKGTSKEMTGTNLVATAKLLKVDPIWLATGEGEARPKPISAEALKPMEASTLTLYRMLTPEEQHEIEAEMNSKIAARSATRSKANPFPSAKAPRLASSAPPDPGPVTTGGMDGGGKKSQPGSKKKVKT